MGDLEFAFSFIVTGAHLAFVSFNSDGLHAPLTLRIMGLWKYGKEPL
jgi:hypothetical protein